jgi:hypothetical protein
MRFPTTIVMLCLFMGSGFCQPNPLWDSGSVQPETTLAGHNVPLPQLRVQTDNRFDYTISYHVLPAGAAIEDAWIEVWDRPLRLLRQHVDVGIAPGKMVWDDDSGQTPRKLTIALFDPDFKEVRICIDNCTAEELTRTLPTSEMVVGLGPDGDPPYPELQIQTVRVVAGSSDLETVLSGRYLARDSRLLVADYDPANRTYNHLQFLPFDYIDLQHLKASVPAALLQHPRVLALNVLPPQEDHRTSEPVFDGVYKTWMPGTSVDYSVSVAVACQQSAQVARLEPKDLPADAAESKGEPAGNSHQNGYQERGAYMHVIGSNFNHDSRVVLGPDPLQGQAFETEFISSKELRFWIESGMLKASSGMTVTLWVTNQKEGCSISNQETFRVLPTDKNQIPLPGGEISTTEPYPIPLMKQNGPKQMELAIRGENFRPNVTVLAKTDNGEYQELKTLFISSEKLLAWLPQAMWRVHGLSFRFVLQTGAGEQAVEIAEPEQ